MSKTPEHYDKMGKMFEKMAEQAEAYPDAQEHYREMAQRNYSARDELQNSTKGESQ